MLPRARFAVVLAFAALSAGVTASSHATQDVIGIQLLLKNAARYGGYAELPGDAYINMAKVGDAWLPVGGQTSINKGLIWGHVESGTVSAGAVNLKVSYWSPCDAFQPGGRGTFDITLTRGPDGALAGTYTGIYWGSGYVGLYVKKATAADKFNAGDICPPTGDVTGTIKVMQTPSADFTPPAPGQHPRILFRSSDLGYLAGKAATDFGKACLAKMEGSATGLGILYRLAAYKGETAKAAEYLDKAKTKMEAHFVDYSNGVDEHGKIAWGFRLEDAANAYDLCYAGWTPEFRNRAAWYLVNTAKVITEFQGEWRGPEQSFDIDFYGINWYSGIGTAGLALMGESGPTVPIFKQFADGQRAPTVAPAAGLSVPAGMSATPLVFRATDNISKVKEPGAGGTIPLPEYIYVTGFHMTNDQYLAPFGGTGNITPKPGDAVSHGGVTRNWEVLSGTGTNSTPWTSPYEVIDIAGLTGRDNYAVTYLYAVLENDAPRWVECKTDIYHEKYSSPLEVEFFINGVRRFPGDFAYLEKGKYNLLVVIPTFHFQPWGTMNIAPRISEPADERRTVNLEFFDYEKAERNKYAASLGAIAEGQPYFAGLAHRCRNALAEFFREVAADGLLFPRDNSRCLVDNMASKFGLACQNVLNVPADVDKDITTGVLATYSGPVPMTGCSYSGRPNKEIYGHTFGYIPANLRDRAKTNWKTYFGVTSDAGELIDADPVYAFLHYPVDNVTVPVKEAARLGAVATLSVRALGASALEYALPASARATLRLFDSRGRTCAVLAAGAAAAGRHRVDLGTSRLPGGAYVVRLVTDKGGVAEESFILAR